MAGSAKRQTRNAIYVLLKADADVIALGGVHNQPPDDASYPYCYIGPVTEVSSETFGRQGRRLTVPVTVVDEDQRDDEGRKMDSEIVAALNRGTLAVSGWTFIYCDLDGGDEFVDENEVRITSRFVVLVESS